MGEHNGGPAFPVVNHTWDPGMSLRDWFAGQFAAALITGSLGRFDDGTVSAYKAGPCNHVVVDRAYVLADAMLKRHSGDLAPKPKV